MRAALGVALWVLLLAAGSRASAQTPDSTARPAVRPVPRDALFGLDKPKHFVVSFFIQSASFAAIQAAGGSRRGAMSGASITAAAIGIGRELHDRRAKGLFSFGDLLWDALGAGTAAVMLRHTYR